MSLPATTLRIACALLLIASVHAGAADALDELAAAREAAQRGNYKLLEAWRTRNAGHPLEAYPTFWILSGSVDRVDAAEVRAFITRFADTPLADLLRREWLRTLATRASWEVFRAEYPRLLADDAELACFALQERQSRGDAEVAAEARVLFARGREVPGACEPVFQSLAAAGVIGEKDVWERIRKLLGAGHLREAKRANQLLGSRQRLDEKQLDRAAADPGGFLAREKASVLTRTARELVVLAVARLARAKPDEAAERLAQFAPRIGPEATQSAWVQIAYRAAMSHHPRALEWFGLAGGASLSDVQSAWKIRAALRAGNWKDLLAAIQALPPEEARDAAWRYWRARALGTLGEREASHGLLRGLAAERNFYGILAAEELGIAAAPDWNGWKPQPADLDRVRALPGLERALALYRIGYESEGFREWVWAIRGMEDRDLLAAAELARLAAVPDRAINTANRTAQLHDLTQRFPIPHREAVAAASRQWGPDEALMYSIIRQESRFMANARSRVGAQGLMQLMPATAKWVAGQIPVQPYNADMLAQPAVNVQMGTYYFARVLGDLGHPVLATAAYNAGPGRAKRWRDARALEGAIYAETIPFNETRDYVKQVFTNAWFYGHRLTGQVPSLKRMLGTIPGRAGDGVDPALAANLP